MRLAQSCNNADGMLFGTHELAPAIADYLAAYPDVSVDLSLDDPYIDLVERRFDLDIRLGNLPESSLVARKLYALTTVVCASPVHLEKHGAPQTPTDLAAHNCLVYDYVTPQNIWNFVDQSGKEERVHVSGRFQATSG